MTTTQMRPEEPFLVPNINDPIFSQGNGVNELIWFIAGAFRLAAPLSLTVQEIRASIEEHQPWRIDRCRGTDKRACAENSIRWILSKSPAFSPDPRTSGYWRMTGAPLVRTLDQLPTSWPEATNVMTEAERRAYLASMDELFSRF